MLAEEKSGNGKETKEPARAPVPHGIRGKFAAWEERLKMRRDEDLRISEAAWTEGCQEAGSKYRERLSRLETELRHFRKPPAPLGPCPAAQLPIMAAGAAAADIMAAGMVASGMAMAGLAAPDAVPAEEKPKKVRRTKRAPRMGPAERWRIHWQYLQTLGITIVECIDYLNYRERNQVRSKEKESLRHRARTEGARETEARCQARIRQLEDELIRQRQAARFR